jgi:outer membrane protein OmpA-like peptidoglycan-associated protein
MNIAQRAAHATPARPFGTSALAPRRFAALAVGFALASSTHDAMAQLRVHANGQLSAPLSRPQMDEFALGGGGGAALEWTAARFLGLVARAQGLALPAFAGALPEGVAHPGTGTLGALTVGFRLRPRGTMFARPADGIWLEVTGGVGITGPQVRPVIDARAGIGYRLGPLGVGPYIAYTRVFEVGATLLPGDAQLFSAGLEFSLAFLEPSAPAIAAHTGATPVARHVEAPVNHCAPQPRITFGDFDRDGCPDGDRDGDGLADVRDRCPEQGEDFDGIEDADGCPDLDNDSDGIIDVFDACPNHPETVNGVEDEDGCPDDGAVQIVRGRIVYNTVIQFAFNSARILAPSYATVQAVATLLSRHPEYATVYIEGHADETGSEHYNYNLSYQRALSLADLLVEFGIRRARLHPMGFGRSSPLDGSGTLQARARNRRVEFVVDGHRSSGRARTATGWVNVRNEDVTE